MSGRGNESWSKNLAFDDLNPSSFSKREGYKEFLDSTIGDQRL